MFHGALPASALWCALLLLSARVVSGSSLFWSFCYFGSDSTTGWSVSVSGSFQSDPFEYVEYASGYRMHSAMGVRNQYDASGALVSSVNVVGVAGINSTAAQNDNLVQTEWPVLTAYGVAFLLDGNVSIPGVTPEHVTDVSSISGEPPVEYPFIATVTTYSYFMYQTANTAEALQCPSPPPAEYVYHYTASEKHTRDSRSLGANLSLWSSCGSGIISLSGPFSFPSSAGISGRPVYIAQDIHGERVFSNGSTVQRINVSGVTSQDGGDYIFYVNVPYVDNAGITMGVSELPTFDTGEFPNQQYINWWAPGDQTMYEAVAAVTADNVMQFTISPYVTGEVVPRCPNTVQSTLFHYCFYADSGDYEVTMTGQLIVNALNVTNGSYWVTAMDGLRTQRDAQGIEQVTQAYDMLYLYDANDQHNNRLYQSQPYIDSFLGITLKLGADDQGNVGSAQPRVLSLLSSPPREQWTPLVNDTIAASTAPTHSYFIYQVGEAPSCPMRANRTAWLQRWGFQYVVRSSSKLWAITCSGSLSVLGPYQQSLAPSRTVYVVVGATGTRTYTDSAGADHVTAIVGLANATLTTASQLLYVTSVTGQFTPDSLGIALQLDGDALFPSGASSALLRLSSSDGATIRETPYSPISSSSNAAGNTTASAASSGEQEFVSLSVDAASPVWTAGSFTVTGDEVSLSYGGAGEWAVAAILLLLAMHAVFAIQRVALKLQSRVSQSHPWRVSGAVLAASLVYGVCGVWAAELLLASTLRLDCPYCVYQYDLELRRSSVLLALLPALLCALPSWFLLSNAAAIVRIRKSVRVADLMSRRKESGTITSGTAASLVTKDSAHSGLSKKSALTNGADSVLDHLSQTLIMLRSNLCLITFVIGMPLAACMVLTRITFEYGLVGPVDVTPLALSNVLCSVLDCLLMWLLVAMHLSGLTWRYAASLFLPLVLLLDFYVASLSRSVVWDTSNSSLSATSLSMSDCWWIGGWMSVVSAGVAIADLAWRLHRRRKLLESRVVQGENKLEWTRKELEAQVGMLRQLRAMYDEVVRVSDVISIARPDASVSTMWQSLLALEPPLDGLEKSGSRCAGYQPLGALTAAGGGVADNGRATPNSLDPLSRIKAMSGAGVGGSISGVLRVAGAANVATISLNKQTASSDRDQTEDTDEVGEMLQDEPIDPATQALIQLLQADHKSRDSIAAGAPNSPAGSSPPNSPGLALRTIQAQLPEEWKPPTGFRPALLDILTHPACLELFKDSMKEQHCIENVMFVCRVRRWADDSTQRQHPQLRALLAEQIARDFIQPDAPYAINIDHASRLSLLKRIRERSHSGSLFSEAEAEVRKLITVNNWNAFSHSPAYALCQQLLWRNAHIMRAIGRMAQQSSKANKAGGGTSSTNKRTIVSRSGQA